MDSFTSGTFVGAGSFSCVSCEYTLTLDGSDELPECPECGGREFIRASLFSTERIPAGAASASAAPDEEGALLAAPVPEGHDERLARAREQIEQPGEYLLYEESGELRTVALTREWTRIGRSLSADVRFDDPTVSRRHALIVRHPDGVRLLDDRSLNGVFVNGARADGQTLSDGDELVIGRYRLSFVSVAGGADAHATSTAEAPTSVHTIG
jgi:predicted  nucleic acid-binding Zn-ribbon protein